MVKFGSARISENGSVNGQRGDQTGHEVEEQNGYIHRNGWKVIRAKSVERANWLAFGMKLACCQDICGYSQSDRLAIYYTDYQAGIPTNADCSSLVSFIVNKTGVSVNAFSTHTEVQELLDTGEFIEVAFVSLDDLYTGDILVDGKCTSHTVIVTEGLSRDWAWITIPQPTLRIGSKGEQVKRLQVFFNEYCGTHLVIDGDFGCCTAKALRDFQTFFNISIDEIYGEQSKNCACMVMCALMYK